MPELPEVQTIVSDLKKILPGLKILDFWTDIPAFSARGARLPDGQGSAFGGKKIKREIMGEKILDINRRGKNILISLTNKKTLLIHQRMTGHLLFGEWKKINNKWISRVKGPLSDDAQNRFIHFIILFAGGKQLALSDLRKFAKVIFLKTEDLNNFPDIADLGPDPTEKTFNFSKFREVLRDKRGKIKTILMDQKIISGIGNIYSDEILWEAGIHPLARIEKLNDKEFKKIFSAVKKTLIRAIKNKGDSMSDYRRPSGEKGNYQKIQNAYHMAGKK